MGPPFCVTDKTPPNISAFAKVTIGQPCPAPRTEDSPCQGGRSLRFGLHPQGSTRIHRFDIISFDFKGAEDQAGVLRSRDEVNKLIAQEITETLPPNRIVVGGFSQGGAMALATGLTTQHKLAGLTVLSGWFTSREKIKEVCGHNPMVVTEMLKRFW